MLLADRQTTGGYPRIAHVATVDIPDVRSAAAGHGGLFRAHHTCRSREFAVGIGEGLPHAKNGDRAQIPIARPPFFRGSFIFLFEKQKMSRQLAQRSVRRLVNKLAVKDKR
ncbi:hypothetical protein [Paenibacillus agaridevorans]|uniref:hypothetical protein n=1 Tax=Paenibacillus agaridevorans TaxID=171404 RepID=UPI0015E82A05|nr:hypothetical protein [Paenibacillus agaridevorans]